MLLILLSILINETRFSIVELNTRYDMFTNYLIIE